MADLARWIMRDESEESLDDLFEAVTAATLCSPYVEEATCRWCGQPLTDPVSVEMGVGPQCVVHDQDAQDLSRELAKIEADDTWYIVERGMAESSAKLCTQALRELDGVEAMYRTEPDGCLIAVRPAPERRDDE
jgi:hypothetical protein